MAEKKQDKGESGKSRKKLLIIIAIAAVVVLAGAGTAAFFLLRSPEPSTDQAAGSVVPGLTQPVTVGPMVKVDEFIVNIISGENPHYVKAAFTLELTAIDAVPEVEQRMPQIRDTILLLIGNKTYEELQDLQGKKQLKAELLSRINAFLVTGKVQSIYFTNFVVQ
jgi:flagellar FliL protein